MQYFSIGRFDGQVHVHLSEGYILDRDAGPTDFTVNLKLRDNYLDDHVTCKNSIFPASSVLNIF